jgi:hypothetical protein
VRAVCGDVLDEAGEARVAGAEAAVCTQVSIESERQRDGNATHRHTSTPLSSFSSTGHRCQIPSRKRHRTEYRALEGGNYLGGGALAPEEASFGSCIDQPGIACAQHSTHHA